MASILEESENLVINGMCFACGENNPHGLRMKVEAEGGQAVSRLTMPDHFQGWVGIAHGGMVAVLLDEIMAHAVLSVGSHGVTTGMQIRFRKPVPLAREIMVKGLVTEVKGRRIKARGEVWLEESSQLLAECEGMFLLRKSD